MIRLYTFCSKLEKYLHNTFALELQQWTTTTEVEVAARSWRSPDQVRKRRRTEAGGGTSSSNGSDNEDIADVDGIEDCGPNDWSTEIMNWQNEAIEGAKEARSISGAGEILSMDRLRQLEESD